MKKTIKEGPQFSLPSKKYVISHFVRYSHSLLSINKELTASLSKIGFIQAGQTFACYVCPLCANNLICLVPDENNKVKTFTTSSFDRDHYPPKNIGGKKTILVCKECNSNAGRIFDHELVKYVNRTNYEKGVLNSTIKDVLATIPGVNHGPYRVTLTRKNPSDHHVLFPKSNKMPLLKEFLLGKSGTHQEISVQYKGLSKEKVRNSILKAAYLYCFALWGYEFVYSPAAGSLREVLFKHKAYPMEGGVFYVLEENIERSLVGPSALTDPDLKMIVVHVPVRLSNGYKCILGVPITEPDDKDFKKLAALIKEKDKKQFTLNPLALTPYNINTEVHGYSLAWETLKKGNFAKV